MLVACGGDSSSDPAPLGTGSARDSGAGTTDLILEASLADTGAGDLAFHGTLASTATVAFGGSYMDANYCKYSVTLKNVSVDLVVQGGQLVASAVKNQMVEAIVGTCNSNQPTIPTNLQTFALSTAATSTSGGFHAEYLSASGNQPKESLVVDLVKDGTGYTASATWHRIDLGKPFDWTVTGTILVTPE